MSATPRGDVGYTGPNRADKRDSVAWRQPLLCVELALSGRLKPCAQVHRGRALGGPERAAGNAGREHGIRIVAQQSGALPQLGIEQRRRLTAGKRTRRRLGEGWGCVRRRDEEEATGEAAGGAPCPSLVIMDGQSLKTAERGVRGFDRHKRAKGRKRHVLVDTLGLPVASRVKPAGMSDQHAGARLLGGLRAALQFAP